MRTNKTRVTKWTASDISKAKDFNPKGESILEFQDNKGEWHDFHVLATPERVVFGGCCNAGFLESGYIERDSCESLDETLQELLSDLEVYYNDGSQHVSRIVCNERM